MRFITINLLLLLFAVQSYAGSYSATEILSLYQPEEKIESLQSEVAFWQKKLDAAPNQLTFKMKLAGAYTALFGTTADIADLRKAESLLQTVVDFKSADSANAFRSLAHNYISQHRFCEAMDLVTAAYDLGSNRRASELMLFDLYEELGDEAAQRSMLQTLSVAQDFNYLIRLAKWQDGQGNLDQTIALMKQAGAIAEEGKQTGRMIWIYTNLADYYGHAGELALSKEHYEKALALNAADWYSMKGLAWMAYSNKENTNEALAILQRIAQNSKDPGIKLLEAEILEFTGQQKKADVIYKDVAKVVSQETYGNMYNSFLCEYFLNQKGKTKQAMSIAEREITVRATPGAYDLKAQVLFAKGDVKGAKQLSKKHIWNHTFEPGILKNQLTYFKGTNDPYLVEITADLQGAKYELGPLVFNKIYRT